MTMTSRGFIKVVGDLPAPAKINNRFDLFPHLTPGDYAGLDLSGNNSSASQIKAAVLDATASKLIIPKGTLIFDDPSGLTLSQPIIIEGTGKRNGTRIFFTGTGTKSVRTKRTHPSDGTDAPMSAAISVESADVVLQDLYLRCFFTATPGAPGSIATYGNWGDDWDCGIFVKSVPYFFTDNVRTDGFWRQAGLYFDVTQDSGGCDFVHIKDSWFKGFWGMRIEGPVPQIPNTDAQPGDLRGAGGMSSTLFERNLFEGNTNTVALRRYNDTDGGGLRMSGRIPTPTGRLNKQTFFSCRSSTAEPFSRQLDYISGVEFYSYHAERTTGIQRADNAGGAAVSDQITANAISISQQNVDIWNITKSWADSALLNDFGGRDGTSSTWSRRRPRINVSSDQKGTYFPELRGTTGQVSGATPYTTQTGKWYRHGSQDELVTVDPLFIQMSDIVGLNGNLSLTLPFAPATAGGSVIITVSNVDTGLDAAPMSLIFSAGSTTALLYKQRDGASIQNATQADVTNASSFRATFTYATSAP